MNQVTRRADQPAPTELRALDEITQLPGGYITIPIKDGGEPHLKWGEFAVIDLNDREPIHGEVYCIVQQHIYGPVYDARQLRCSPVTWYREGGNEDGTGWWIGPLDRNTPILSDGPLTEEHARKKIIGRVVGFYRPIR